ncbi:MAG: hypothetical protein LKE41_00970 [Prevotella sp.]|jgi:hypothetical protein|nr:hypothetical protein [Prevotella sp.]
MSKYLDLNGLSTLWGKIKDKFVTKDDFNTAMSSKQNVLGINPTGSANKFLNQQGSFVAVETDLSAYAKKTDIPTTLPASDVKAWAKADSKPTYTKDEIGLGNVDNTADAAKDVKHAKSADSVAWSGVTGKPTIPDVNDSVITINQGGNKIASFSLNQKTGATIDLPEGKAYSNATQTSDGLMSSADKKKLDGIGTGSYLTQEDGDKRYMLKGASNEAVIITVESPDGKGDLPGTVIDIVKADDNTLIREITYNGSPLTVQVTGGVTYKVIVKKIASGYTLPIDQQFLAVADTTRSVRITAIPLGVYIEMTDGSLVTADNYSGGTYAYNARVNSIIVATANWTGRILPDADLHSKTMKWTPSSPGKQVSKTMSSDSTVAETDMDGAENTQALLNVYGSGVTENFAAGYAYNKTFRSGKHGYLPALGELKMIYANATEVNKCLAKLIGQSDCIGNHWFLSSTQINETNAWNWQTRSSWNNWNSLNNVLVLSAL